MSLLIVGATVFHMSLAPGDLGEHRGRVQTTEANMEFPQQVKDELTNRFKSRFPNGKIIFEGQLILTLQTPDSPSYFAYESVEDFNKYN